VLQQARQDLLDCGAYGDIQVNRQALSVVRDWLDIYETVMGGETTSEVVSNSDEAKSALCEPGGSGSEGFCDDPNGAFFWSKSLTYGCRANVLVRRTDGQFVLVDDLDTTWGPSEERSDERSEDATDDVSEARDTRCTDGTKPVVHSFERGGFLHVQANYMVAQDVTSGTSSYSSQLDVFVDPTAGDQLFSYLQRDMVIGGEEPFPIQSINIVDNHAILTGPDCHVAIRLLPAKKVTKK